MRTQRLGRTRVKDIRGLVAGLVQGSAGTALRIRRVDNNFEPYLRASMCATTDKCDNGTWVRAQGQTKTKSQAKPSQACPGECQCNTHTHTHIFYSGLTSTVRLQRALWLIWQLPSITLKRWGKEIREEYLKSKEYDRNIYLTDFQSR